MRKGIPSLWSTPLRRAPVARLATIDKRGRPHAVPVCFVYDGRAFHIALDLKPKKVPLERLARVQNIAANPRVALLVDEYCEDWGHLWYVLIRGRARLLVRESDATRRKAIRALRHKYPQYRAGLLPDGAPVIRIVPDRITAWGNP